MVASAALPSEPVDPSLRPAWTIFFMRVKEYCNECINEIFKRFRGTKMRFHFLFFNIFFRSPHLWIKIVYHAFIGGGGGGGSH